MMDPDVKKGMDLMYELVKESDDGFLEILEECTYWLMTKSTDFDREEQFRHVTESIWNLLEVLLYMRLETAMKVQVVELRRTLANLILEAEEKEGGV